MNILIKLTCLIGLVIAPILGGHAEEGLTEIQNEVIIEATENSQDYAEATISYTKIINGKTIKNSEVFKGTQKEVKAKIDAFEKTNVDNSITVEEVKIEKTISKE